MVSNATLSCTRFLAGGSRSLKTLRWYSGGCHTAFVQWRRTIELPTGYATGAPRSSGPLIPKFCGTRTQGPWYTRRELCLLSVGKLNTRIDTWKWIWYSNIARSRRHSPIISNNLMIFRAFHSQSHSDSTGEWTTENHSRIIYPLIPIDTAGPKEKFLTG